MPEVNPTLTSSHPRTPAVVFIAGSGRSGSTLLERTLGAIPGFVNVGELLDLPRRVVPKDELCGCGVPVSQCPFWTGVADRLPGGFSPDAMASLHGLQARVARQRHMPRLVAPTGEFATELSDYAGRLAELYRAVAAESGAEYVVDASKWPSLAFALYRGGIDVRVIHLVRDVRGVAHSLSRDDVARPHAAPGDTEAMWTNAPASGAGRWLATQSEVDLLAGLGMRVARVRYDDFVSDPAAAVSAALAELACYVPPGGLDHIDGRTVTLGASHGLSGNPSRFTLGDITLRPDVRWRDGMAPRDQKVVTAIGLPQVLRYNHAPESSAAAEGASRAADAHPWPLVSVMVPTRGRPALVREAIASVVDQTYPGEIEILLIHDQEEEDQSVIELARPGRSITVLSNTQSPGLAGARNTAIDQVKGEFVATLDDDDVWHPTKLEKQVDRFYTEPDLVMLGAGYRVILPEGRSALWFGRSDRITYDMLLANRVKELHSSTLIMRRDVFAKAGRYDETLPRGYGEDYDFVMRVARIGMVGVVREPLADIRRDMGGSYYQHRAEFTAPALEHFLSTHPDIETSRRGHARMLGQMAFARSSLGERKVAWRYAAKGWSRWPLSPHPYVAFGHLATGADPAQFAKLARKLGRGMA